MSQKRPSTNYAGGWPDVSWVTRIVRRLLGRTRYHEQANEVNLRVLRAERLARMANDAVRRARLAEELDRRRSHPAR